MGVERNDMEHVGRLWHLFAEYHLATVSYRIVSYTTAQGSKEERKKGVASPPAVSTDKP